MYILSYFDILPQPVWEYFKKTIIYVSPFLVGYNLNIACENTNFCSDINKIPVSNPYMTFIIGFHILVNM